MFFVLLQNYTRQMAECLAATGQDMASPSGFRLRQVLDEYSCIHAVRARADLLGHKTHIADPATYSGEECAAVQPFPDYKAMVVRLHPSLMRTWAYRIGVLHSALRPQASTETRLISEYT